MNRQQTHFTYQTASAYPEAKEPDKETDNFVLLGRLVGGITHELNTPIGSATAAASNIEELLILTQQRQAALCKMLDAASQDRVAEFLALLQNDNALPPLSTREERALRRKYSQALEDIAVEEPEEIATLLIESGFRSEVQALQPLLQNPAAREILEFANLQGQIQKNIANLKTASQKAMRLVRSVKDFIQISETKTPAFINLHELLDVLLCLYHNHIKYGISLETSFGILPEIETYPSLLAQTLAALLEHSIEAMQRKGILKVEAQSYVNVIEVRIEDTRPVIEPSLLHRFFEPSYLAPIYGAKQAKKLTEAVETIISLGGTIDCEQKEERFAMILTLPLQLSH
jgi:signal transduction histidine kinase